MNKKLIGFVIIVLSIGAMGIWEFWGRESISYEEILVLKEPLSANTILSVEDFELKRVESPSRNALRQKDMKKIIGMETSQYVAEGIELRKEYFQSSEYFVGKDSGKGILALSTDWLLSYPQTIARGDKLSLYNGKTKVGDCMVSHVRDSSNNEIVFSGRDRQSSTGIVLYVEIIADLATLIDVSTLAGKGIRFSLISLQ